MATEWCRTCKGKISLSFWQSTKTQLIFNSTFIEFNYQIHPPSYLRQNRKREKKRTAIRRKKSTTATNWIYGHHEAAIFAILLIWLVQPEIFDWFVDIVRGIEIDVLRIVSISWLNAKKSMHTHIHTRLSQNAFSLKIKLSTIVLALRFIFFFFGLFLLAFIWCLFSGTCRFWLSH